MQIVIEITEHDMEWIRNEYKIPEEINQKITEAIIYGTPLPKGHGDLIDRTELYNQTANWEAQALEQVNKYDPMYSRDDWRWWSAVLKERGAFKHDVADATTVIPADKENE